VKQPKKKPEAWNLTWHVATFLNHVAIEQRPETGIWAKMWAFSETPPPDSFAEAGDLCSPVNHILTHKRITATFKHWQAPDLSTLRTHAKNHGGEVVTWTEFEQRARPRLLTKIWNELCLEKG
tara:strand:+ start:92 stop:460 length:369 start_codon:yes stop_codon:yes gene_type:complete